MKNNYTYKTNLCESKIGFTSLFLLSFLVFVHTQAWAQCPEPTNRMATNITSTTADLSWDVVGEADSYTINYRVLGASQWIAMDAGTNSATLTGLLSGTTYMWRVQSVCGAEKSSFTSPAILFTTTGASACRIPENTDEVNLTDVGVLLNWNDVAGAASYIIFYKQLGQTSWTEATSTTSGFNLTGLTPQTSYVWKVRTVCSSTLFSKFSQGNPFTTLPECETPSNLNSSNATDNSVDLDWDDVGDATSYRVQHRVLGVTTWTNTNVGTSNVVLTGLEPGLTYQWRVRTTCTGGVNSDFAAVQNFTTTGTANCQQATNLLSSNEMDNSVDLNWDAAGGAISYSVQYRVQGASTWITTSTATNSVMLTGLEPGVTYQWKVRTECSSTVVSQFTDPSTFTTTGTPNCETPSGLLSSNITDTSADLDWNAASGAVSYTVEYKLLGAPDWVQSSSGTNSISLAGLFSGQTYQYRIRSVCSGELVSAFSDSEFFMTTGAPDCPFPDNLQTSGITDTSAEISWDAVGTAINYVVFFKQFGETDWTETTTTETSTTLAGLDPGTSYQWKVRSVCSADNSLLSTFSDASTFTTTMGTTNFETDDNIAVMNMQGKLVNTFKGETTLSDIIMTLDQGLYIMKVSNGQSVSTRRIAVQ